MQEVFYLGKDFLTTGKVLKISEGSMRMAVDKETIRKIEQSHQYTLKIASEDSAVYGINTGFGPLCNTRVSGRETALLQKNLLYSHSVGVGEFLDLKTAKIMMILKVHALCYGFSGISLGLIRRIIWHINNNIIPAVPEQGSVGASGDLAPLSHLFLPLIGEGKLNDNGTFEPAKEILYKYNLEPLELGPKEGLALINGTQFITAHGVQLVDLYYQNLAHADIIAAMTLDALESSIMPFHKALHNLRPYQANIYTAAKIHSLLKDSAILDSHKNCEKVQDPYSLRCIPQVHGASRTAWLHLKETIEIEINSVTDNPIILNDELTISGGNFHGQPAALPIDYACLGLSELGSISDRRMYLTLEGRNSVPQLLMKETGLNSGFMILQYTAAALASENKTSCFPASADSITTSLGQEDHVSMGSIGARKALKVARNTQKILAIELCCAAQALDFKRPLKSGPVIETVHELIRSKVPFATKDDLFGNYINESIALLESNKIIEIEKSLKNDPYTEFDEVFEVY